MSDDSVEVLYSQVDIIVDLFVHSLIHGAWVSVDQKQQEDIWKSSHKHNFNRAGQYVQLAIQPN